MTTTTRTDTLTLNCDICGKPVTGQSGYITVNTTDAYRHSVAVKEWEERTARKSRERHPTLSKDFPPVMDGSDLLDYPDPAPWRIYHGECDPDPDCNSYWFDAYRCSTERDLLG